MEIYIFVPNQINKAEGDEANGIAAYTEAVNNLKRDSISVKTVGIVSLCIAFLHGCLLFIR